MSDGDYITTTVSTCRTCGRLLPARVHLDEGAVWFHKVCPEHGRQVVRVYSDAEQYGQLHHYHRAGSIPLQFGRPFAEGCPGSCGLCPEHEQHVCLPIVEITDHCDLACPICLVDNRASYHLTVGQVDRMLDDLVASEGRIDVVNLSGGEPTLHPRFRAIVDACLARPEILRVSVSTHGLTLLRDPSLLAFLAERRVVISLQFDGLREATYRRLRGRPLLTEKLRLIDRAGERGAVMSLTVTVAAGINDDEVADITGLLFSHDHILSLMFQPASYVGRAARLDRPRAATTIPDVIRELDGAAGGTVHAGDFAPLPCSHPACFALAFYLRCEERRFLSVKGLVQAERYLDMLQNRSLFGTDPESFAVVKDAIYTLWSGPAALTPDSQRALGAVRHLLAAAGGSPGCCAGRLLDAAQRGMKSIFIHHFMDRDSFDLSRARKCCNVYPQADGRMVPACIHNCLRRSP